MRVRVRVHGFSSTSASVTREGVIRRDAEELEQLRAEVVRLRARVELLEAEAREDLTCSCTCDVGADLPLLFWVRDSLRDSGVPALRCANDAWQVQLGLSAPVVDLDQIFALIHPEDREWGIELMALSATDMPTRTIRLIHQRSGATRHYRIHVVRIRCKGTDQVAGFGEDITEQRAVERALWDSETRYRSVVLAMTEGIVVHGPDGEIVTSNPSAERILGLTLDQMRGRTSLDPRWRCIREDGSPFPGHEHPGYVTLRTGEPFTGVIMGVHKPEGDLRWISVNSRRVTQPDEHGAYSVVASFTDITTRKLTNEQLEASLHEKEVLLREIHHRVKNNLQIITSLLYLQASTTDEPRLATLLTESKNRVGSMALIHQMLYEAASDLAQIPFGDYVEELGTSLLRSHGLGDGRVAFEVDASDVLLGLNVAIPCGLLLNELISNALKHAFPGARRGALRVTLRREGEACSLRVADDGIGLPPDFEARRATSLGVKLVERLVHQLGGAIERTSEGEGTRYLIAFTMPSDTR